MKIFKSSPTNLLKSFIKEYNTAFYFASLGSRIAHHTSGRAEFRFNQITQSAPIDPFRLISIDPETVEYRLSPTFDSSYYLFARYSPVLPGDWDQTRRSSLSEYDLYKSIQQHFRQDVPWRDTEFYARVAKEFETTESHFKWGSSSIEEFDERCQRLDELYKQMCTTGYLTQESIRGRQIDPIERDREHRSVWLLPPALHEVTIHIGRDGELIFHEGRNRFSIAVAAEIPSIPVRVHNRHSKWQYRREQVAQSERLVNLDDELQQFLDHPDMQDVRPDG